jgi:hypothetical protein
VGRRFSSNGEAFPAGRAFPNTYSAFEDAGIEEHLEYVVVGLARFLESGCAIKR